MKDKHQFHRPYGILLRVKPRTGFLIVVAALACLTVPEVQAQCPCVEDPYTHKTTNPCPEFSTCKLPADTTAASRNNSERTVTEPEHPPKYKSSGYKGPSDARDYRVRVATGLIEDKDGTFHPAPGYKWVSDTPGDLSVMLMPGLIEAEDGKLHPAPGYSWASDAPGDLHVILTPGLIEDKDGTFHPAAGYKWVSDTPGDLRVMLMPGLIEGQDGRLQPAPGYKWASDAPGDFRVMLPAAGHQWVSTAPGDLRVMLMPGLIEDKDGTLHPAPGYKWASDAPGDLHVESVEIRREPLAQQLQQEATGNASGSPQVPKTAGEQLLAAAALNGETKPVFDSGNAPYAGSLDTFQASVDGRPMTIDINKLPDRIKNDPDFKKLNEERVLWQKKAQKLNIELAALRAKRETPGVNKPEIDLQAVPVKEDLVKAEKATHEVEVKMQSFVIDTTETDAQPATSPPKKNNNPI